MLPPHPYGEEALLVLSKARKIMDTPICVDGEALRLKVELFRLQNAAGMWTNSEERNRRKEQSFAFPLEGECHSFIRC